MAALRAEQRSRGTGESPPSSQMGGDLGQEGAAQKEGSTGWGAVGDKETGRR